MGDQPGSGVNHNDLPAHLLCITHGRRSIVDNVIKQIAQHGLQRFYLTAANSAIKNKRGTLFINSILPFVGDLCIFYWTPNSSGSIIIRSHP